MKTKEELNALKDEVEAVRGKLAELTPEELAEVGGGTVVHVKGDDVAKLNAAEEALQGKVAGVVVTSTSGQSGTDMGIHVR